MSLPTCRVGQVMVHQLSSTSWHRAPQFREFNGLLTLSRWQIYCSLFFPRPTKRCSLYMFMQLKLSRLQVNCCLLNCLGVFFSNFCCSVRISFFTWVNSYNYLIITVWSSVIQSFLLRHSFSIRLVSYNGRGRARLAAMLVRPQIQTLTMRMTSAVQKRIAVKVFALTS